MVPFEEAFEDITRSNAKLPQSKYLPAGDYAVVDQGKEMIAGYTDDASLRFKHDDPVVVFGDHTRAIKYVDFPFVLGADGLKVLKVHRDWDSRYAYHYLRSVDIPSAGYSRHFKFLRDISVPKPPIAAQRRIATILDQADAVLTMRRRVLTRVDALRQSIMVDFVSSTSATECKLKELVDADDRLNYGVVQPGEAVQNGVPLVRVSDLKSGRVDRAALKLIDFGIDRSHSHSRLRGTEVLVVCVGMTIGKIALAEPADAGSNVARAVARVPISDPNLRMFVAAYLQTEEIQRYFRGELRTVAQPTLNIKQLGETRLNVPPRRDLDRICSRLTAIDTQRQLARAALTAVETLCTSLQSRAFSGQL